MGANLTLYNGRQEIAYFGDPYNPGGLNKQLGFSWWEHIRPLVNKHGILKHNCVDKFLLYATAKIILSFPNPTKVHLDYYVKEQAKLVDMLLKVKKHKYTLKCSL